MSGKLISDGNGARWNLRRGILCNPQGELEIRNTRRGRMRRLDVVIQTVLVALIFPFALRAQTVDDIVSNAIMARGGAATISGVQTEKLAGTISFGTQRENVFEVDLKRPGRIRQRIEFNGKDFISAADGVSGWIINPFQGDTVRPMTKDEVKNSASSAELDGPFLNYKEIGTSIKLAGRENVKGHDAYRLNVTMKDGSERSDLIDCNTFLELKWEGNVLSDGKRYKVESYFKDYRNIKGIMIAFAIDSDTPGTARSQKIRFKSVEVNGALPDSLFAPPQHR